MRTSIFALLAVPSFLAGAVVACTVDNPNHCTNKSNPETVCGEGLACLDDDCGGKFELTREDGCYAVATLLAVEAEHDVTCKVKGDWPPGTETGSDTDSDDSTTPTGTETGESSTGETNTGTGSGSTSSVSTGTSTGTTSEETSSTSSTDGKCDGDEDCAMMSGATVCDTESGECVECNGEGTTLGCSGGEVCSSNQSCVACVEDENCLVGGMMGVCLVDAGNAENNRCVDCRSNVNCTEDEGKPTCDLNTNACRACGGETIVEEGECGEGACIPWDGDDLAGQCASDVIWVSGTNCDDGNDGDESNPLCTVGAAIDKAVDDQLLTIRIKNDYEESQDESLLVGGKKQIALIGSVAEGPRIEMLKGDVALSDSALKVSGQAKVWVRGLSWTNYAKDGLECTGGGQVWMEWVKFQTKADVPGAGSGIKTTGCEVEVKRGEILGNEMYGVKVEGGEVWMENVIVAKNVSSSADAGGVHVGGGGKVHMNHVTVAENTKTGSSGFNVLCVASESTVEIRNSLVLGSKAESFNDCSLATSFSIEQSVIDDGGIVVSGTSKILSESESEAVLDASTGIFVKTAEFDYRLKETSDHLSKLAGVVTHASTDPEVDLDNNDRPAANAADYPGADQPD